jgi:hypothetical protein
VPGHIGRAKYALDTNLFIPGMRTALAAARLAEFHDFFAPFEYLSSSSFRSCERDSGRRQPPSASMLLWSG